MAVDDVGSSPPTTSVPAPTTPPPVPSTTTSTEPPAPAPVRSLVINEIQAGNDSTIRDEAGGLDDWIELYNDGPAEVFLDGWSIEDGSRRWVAPAGIFVPAGGRVLVWADEAVAEGEWHAPFSLSGEGESLTLLDPTGRVADDVTWPALVDDTVYGRFPDGAAWAASIDATPDAPNPADPGGSTDPSDGLFPDDQMVRFDIEMSQAAIDQLYADPYTYVPAALTYAGVRFEPVGVHIKGQWGSFRYPDAKMALKVDLREYDDSFRLRGLEKLTLNNMVQDWSCVHETLAYELMRQCDVPGPRTAWAEVYLNGEYRGLYLHLESIDDVFLARWFASAEGNLYEGEYGQDLSLGWIDGLEVDEQGALAVPDRADLVALATLIAQPPTEGLVGDLEAIVDVDRTLRALAVETVIGHWDGYFYYPNNWRVYHEPTSGQFQLLPSGVDQTFGWSADLYAAAGDLAWWMLEIPSVRARYDLALWEVADKLGALDVRQRVDDAVPVFWPSLQADGYREMTTSSAASSIDGTISWAEARPAQIYDVLFP